MKKITYQRLYNITLYYLGRYESTTDKVRQMLCRRVQKSKLAGDEVPDEVNAWIDKVVLSMQDLGYIDNRRYLENTYRRLRLQGKSLRFIFGKLSADGIEADMLQSFMDEQNASSEELDIESARRLVCKKKIGYLRPKDKQKEMYQKDLATLARAGFSFDVAKKALSGEDV